MKIKAQKKGVRAIAEAASVIQQSEETTATAIISDKHCIQNNQP